MAATHKVVNGVKVPLSPAEAVAIEAEWAANPPPTAQQQLERLLAQANAAPDHLEDRGMMVLRALVIELVADRNMLAGKVNAILDAADGAASLAQFKTATAAIANAPTYTASQVRTALANRVTAGEADA